MTSGSQGGSPRTTTMMSSTDAARPAVALTLMRFGRSRFSGGRRADAENAAAATRKLSATHSLKLPSNPSHGTRIKPLANEPAIAPIVLAAYASPTVRPVVPASLRLEMILTTNGNNAPNKNVGTIITNDAIKKRANNKTPNELL